MRRIVLAFTLAVLVVVPASARKISANKPEPVSVSGKVTDSNGLPIAEADVLLIDHRSHESLAGKSDATGHFSIKHQRDAFDSLHIVPPAGRGMAEALVKDIPMNEGRHIVVKLKPGVEVTGRVIAGGRPMKGVIVRAIPKSGDILHDSGEAVTNRKGQYTLFLTPGEKIIEITNAEDKSKIGLHRERHIVRIAGPLPDIEVPSNRTAEAE